MIFDKFDQALYENFESIKPQIEMFLEEQFKENEEEEDEGSAKPKLPEKRLKKLLVENTWTRDAYLCETAQTLMKEIGTDLFPNHNVFRDKVEDALKKYDIKLSGPDKKAILRAASWHEDDAPAVIAKIHKAAETADPLHGVFETKVDGKTLVVEYEPDPGLRDSEQVPLLEEGGIQAFFMREVLPFIPDAWIKSDKPKVGFEISFARHFYLPQMPPELEQIRANIFDLEKEAEDLLKQIMDVKNG
jgi:type I restriction enzyme M protein